MSRSMQMSCGTAPRYVDSAALVVVAGIAKLARYRKRRLMACQRKRQTHMSYVLNLLAWQDVVVSSVTTSIELTELFRGQIPIGVG